MTATMGPTASFRLITDMVPERDRIEVMREVYGRTVLKVDLDPLGPTQVDMKVRALPGLGIATGTSSEFRVHHSTSLIESDDLILLAALDGASVMKHRGREEAVGNGQALMMSGEEVGLNVIQPGGFRFVNMSFSLRELSPLIGDPARALMQPLATGSGPMRLLLDYVQSLQDSGDALTPETWRLATAHMFDLVALAMGATREAAEIARGRGVRVARLRAIKADIAAHGGHGGLSAEDIARRHRLSARYIRKLFEGEGTSLSDFMLGQRLLRAHRMLSDPRHSGRSITAIAFEAGFNDLSYFNRAFRRRYDATPSDVRAGASKS
ncbi:AraC family transcriptional regulator [Mesorhizobium sp. NZP2234]|jgi:AraC-like DNA-binding protein|uniref:helix-turn-helix transcriptional regulator n=1 Tax=Mesorhizobium sp. NZP2234 TaxID=2483402 RepID=UPI00155194C2|nr:AraC family transcriptional regulator [Mesorhizobium sp. NZP2234]QKC87988.1 AraC family transcriptional regulator [Mesorhizobium sp. NZP2234]